MEVAGNEKGIKEIAEEYGGERKDENAKWERRREKFRTANEENEGLGKKESADGERRGEYHKHFEGFVGDETKLFGVMKNISRKKRKHEPGDHSGEKSEILDDLVRGIVDADIGAPLENGEKYGVRLEIGERNDGDHADRK